MIKFNNLDLNLMKVFYFLYTTQSVYQAAEHLNISQSACSHSLARLRERLNDELFIRVKGKMLPTQQAKILAQSVLPALESLMGGLTSQITFEPRNGKHEFIVSGYDFSAWCVMPKLSAYLARNFPNISVKFLQSPIQVPIEDLETGKVDISFGFGHEVEQSSQIGSGIWCSGKYVIAMDRCHPLASNSSTFTLDNFLSYQHVLVTPWNEPRGIVDKTLGKLNKKRNIAVTLPSVLTAPYLLQGTDYLLAIPEAYVRTLAPTLGLTYQLPPLAVPDYQISFYWHKLRETEPKLSWFIRLINQLSNLD